LEAVTDFLTDVFLGLFWVALAVTVERFAAAAETRLEPAGVPTPDAPTRGMDAVSEDGSGATLDGTNSLSIRILGATNRPPVKCSAFQCATPS